MHCAIYRCLLSTSSLAALFNTHPNWNDKEKGRKTDGRKVKIYLLPSGIFDFLFALQLRKVILPFFSHLCNGCCFERDFHSRKLAWSVVEVSTVNGITRFKCSKDLLECDKFCSRDLVKFLALIQSLFPWWLRACICVTGRIVYDFWNVQWGGVQVTLDKLRLLCW